jgi:hypothetical protein
MLMYGAKTEKVYYNEQKTCYIMAREVNAEKTKNMFMYREPE